MVHQLQIGLRTLAVASTFWLAVSGYATAQKYKADAVTTMETRALRSLQGNVRKMLKGGPFDAQAFDQWYNKYYIASMTSPKAGDLGKLAAKRRVLVKELSVAAASDTAHQALLKSIRDRAMKVAKGNYHPAVKFNFVYLLGQLNETEASRQPAVPLKSVFPTLIQLADKGDSDAVKVAALLGIHRHMELRGQFPSISGTLSPQETKRVVDLMKSIVEATSPPKDRTLSGHQWMQSIAAETLGFIGDPKTATTLGKLVLQPSAGLSARCAAAKAIGRIDLTKQAGLGAKLVAPFSKLAAECCATEHSLLAKFDEEAEQPAIESSDDRFSDLRSVPSRQRLLTCLLDIKSGLVGPNGNGGLKAVAPTAEPLLQQVNATIEALQNTTTSVNELAETIHQQAERLKTM